MDPDSLSIPVAKNKIKRKEITEAIDPEPILEDYLKSTRHVDYRLKLIDDFSNEDEFKIKDMCAHNFKNLYETYRKYLDPECKCE